MFTGYPTYWRYRTLSLAEPFQQGEDVYALQTALEALSYDVGTVDGVLGPKTSDAITRAQRGLGVYVDGLCGGKTQEALALKLAARVQGEYVLPNGLLRGQLEHESGFRLGNYSALRADGSYDAGVTQRNTAHTPARTAFTVPTSIDALGDLVRDHYDLFAGLRNPRRWQLAQGAWNAPAFAAYIAREEGATHVAASMTARPSAASRAALEAYIDSVSAYLT